MAPAALAAPFAQALRREGRAGEIVLNDINRELAEGHMLDL